MSPSRIQTKICGLSTPAAVQASLAGGASHLGLMFFAKSPRNIDPAAAARLVQGVRGQARIVAVTVDPSDDLIDDIARALKPDLIQLHGKESPARARDVGLRAGVGIIKALPVAEARDLEAARAYDGLVEHLMFEGKPPRDADRPGGVGARFDWTLMAGRRFERPWFLAGGLDPWNVEEAVRRSGAPAVDVSSGVERGPGLKDPALITAFLDAVRRA